MTDETAFQYTYSAACNQEVLNIRNKYLPRQETKLEELQRLDRQVQAAGIPESLSVGTFSCLIFGMGMCFAMEIMGNMVWLGVLLGLVGAAGMALAYPVYRTTFQKAKAQYAPRILELASELEANLNKTETI